MSAPTSTTSIDDLPPEMISELFKYLPLKDLVACSLVNKRFNSIYTNFKMHSLVVAYENNNELFWWYDTKQMVEEIFCPPVMFQRLIEKPLLSHLKHLAIRTYRPEFGLNELNSFQHLVHLEIHLDDFPSEKVHLNLPRLNVFGLYGSYHRYALVIDCPELRTLIYKNYSYSHENANLFEVKHPETIRKLVTNMICAKLAPFKGVECLVTPHLEAISKATLRSLPRLRKLHYKKDRRDPLFSYRQSIGTFDRMKRTLSEFQNHVKELRGSDFHFTFAGLKLTNNTNVEQIDFGVQVKDGEETERDDEYIYMKNYQLIEPGSLHCVHDVNYTELVNALTGEFPSCFLQKFTNIHEVQVADVVKDPDHLLRFLASLRSLRSLRLPVTALGQEFYDQLPESAGSLTILHLEYGDCKNELQLNFEFIGRLSHLSSLKSFHDLSFESLPSLAKWFGRLKGVFCTVRLREESIYISKWRDLTEWQIEKKIPYSHAGERLLDTKNPEEILNLFQERYVQRSVVTDQ